MEVTTLPQLAGERLLPNGCTRMRALRGAFVCGLTKQTEDAPFEDSRSPIVLYAFGKSTDHALKSDAPSFAIVRTCATRVPRDCGKYVSVVSAVELTKDRDKSSMTRYFGSCRPCCSAMQNLGDITVCDRSDRVTGTGFDNRPL